MFSFVDENRHLMNITLTDSYELRWFTEIIDYNQTETVKDFSIEILMA